jgi:hypothetical protein
MLSITIDDKFRAVHNISPTPRWGHGKPAHPRFLDVIEQARPRIMRALNEIDLSRGVLRNIKNEIDNDDTISPYWNNPWFSSLDAASLVGFILSRKPNRYFEIGSGFSTKFAKYAIEQGKLSTTVTSIDPHPRSEIDVLCDTVSRTALEDYDLAEFEKLEAGDILFLDGSHRVLTNSDVTVFFLEILPSLKPGVLIHIHDIFLPFDYTPHWNNLLYSEQYLLAAMLLCEARPFSIVLPNYFACNDPEISLRVKDILDGIVSMNYNNGANIPGVSFWMESCLVSTQLSSAK